MRALEGLTTVVKTMLTRPLSKMVTAPSPIQLASGTQRRGGARRRKMAEQLRFLMFHVGVSIVLLRNACEVASGPYAPK